MPLAHYGVVIGTLMRFYRDPPDDFGRWYHGYGEVQTPDGVGMSALDVDTPTGVGISYRVSTRLGPAALGPVATLPHGFHELPRTPGSGAIDYLRSSFLQDRLFVVELPRQLGLPRRVQPLPSPPAEALPVPPRPTGMPERLQEVVRRQIERLNERLPVRAPLRLRPWLRSNGDNALKALEAELTGARKVYLFGERFRDGGRGVHDVHQNQGDPAGSRWWASNGIWQDGAVGVERENGTLFVWQVRFNSQATRTDDQGHPA